MPHRCLSRHSISDFQQISLLEVLLRIEADLDRLTRSERCHTSVAGSIIHRRVIIRSEPSSLMANYSKIERVKLLWSYIAMAVEGNWNLEKQEDIGKVERGPEKLRRETTERLNEDNGLKSKTTQDHCLCL